MAKAKQRKAKVAAVQGMTMPGGKQVRKSSPDVYTAFMFVSVVALAVALGVMFRSASIVGPKGSAFALHEAGRVELAER